MMSAVDDGVGSILAKLRNFALERDTLIFFLSDNGGASGASNRPLNGSKARFWEGGYRVPFLLQWPAQISGALEYKEPIISLDIFTTAVVAAGAKMPADRIMDGVDLLPFLSGKKKTPPHEILFWRDLEQYKSWGKGYAVRKGKWKLFGQPKDYDWRRGTPELRQKYANVYEQPYNSVAELYASKPERVDDYDSRLVQLFDLSLDISETKNLASQYPEVVAELIKEYKRWESEVMWPRWERPYWERFPITRLAEFEKNRLKGKNT
jgi:arylsulfatase A-like enzyme